MKTYQLLFFVWAIVTTLWLLKTFADANRRKEQREKRAKAARAAAAAKAAPPEA